MKTFIPIILTVITVFTSCTSDRKSYYMYTGAYTTTEDEGINVYEYVPSAPLVKYLYTVKNIKDPSYLIIHPGGKYLYAVNELMYFNGDSTGAVSAYAIDQKTGNLSFINTRPTGGTAPCHLTFDPSGKWLFVANYGSGNVSVFPLMENGEIGERTDLVQHYGSGINPDRQKGPHAHQVVFSERSGILYVADLGLDKVFRYIFNTVSGKLSPDALPWIEVPSGSGPRHIALAANDTRVYVLGEMSSTIMVFTIHDGNKAQMIQQISMLPDNFSGTNTGAELSISPDGKFLYASNRGDNTLVQFSIDQQSGKLKKAAHYPSGGENPRFFCFDPTGSFVFSANQTSDNIVVYKYIPETGSLTGTGIELQLSKPVCIAFYPMEGKQAGK